MSDNNNFLDPRSIPTSTLDFNMLTTDSTWGKDEVSKDLRTRLTQHIINNKGEATTRELWGILSFFSRDMRLANLSKAEMNYCGYYLDLAGDFLNEDAIEPFIISLGRSASILELSQSKKGFLRKRMNTQSTEYRDNSNPAKMSLFGKTKRSD